MKYPMIDITEVGWSQNRDFADNNLLFDQYVYREDEIDFLDDVKGSIYCDCCGDLYTISHLIQPEAFWRHLFKFIPMVYKCTIVMKPLYQKYTLEELRSFLLSKVSQMEQDSITFDWIAQIENAQNHEELIVGDIGSN